MANNYVLVSLVIFILLNTLVLKSKEPVLSMVEQTFEDITEDPKDFIKEDEKDEEVEVVDSNGDNDYTDDEETEGKYRDEFDLDDAQENKEKAAIDELKNDLKTSSNDFDVAVRPITKTAAIKQMSWSKLFITQAYSFFTSFTV